MKKLALLFMLAMASMAGTMAQPSPQASNEIIWQLDSLIPCYHFHVVDAGPYHRDSLNKYNFAPDSLPPMSSDVVQQRLNEIGSAIPMSYNDDVQAFINLYTLQRREQVERMLGLSHVYFPIFDEVLDREGVPMELHYLPIVESALITHARSRVGATGLWQFMLGTGQLYNLKVTSFVDERRDPYKSTEAAVRYLKNMYRTYGDWLLVIAAYNCGPGNVNKAIARSGGKRTFWEIQEFLPRETRSYVPAFIAATYVFNYHAEHNLFPRMVDFTYAQDTVHVVRQQMSLKHFADYTGTDFWALKDLNPELKADIIPYEPNGYVLRVPNKTGQYFATFRDSIMTLARTLHVDSAKIVYSDTKVSPLTSKPYVAEVANHEATSGGTYIGDGKKLVYHKVRRGEVVGSIAARYHVSAKDISKWNGLHNYNIQVGQNLKIYVKGAPTAVVKPAQTQPVAQANTPVKDPETAGDNATASVEGADPAEPAKAEPVKVEPVKAQPVADTKEQMVAKYHVVRQGDTLWQIANAYDGLTVEKLKTLNALPDNRIAIGQKLRVQ